MSLNPDRTGLTAIDCYIRDHQGMDAAVSWLWKTIFPYIQSQEGWISAVEDLFLEEMTA